MLKLLPNRRRHSGFSIIELMTAILVVVVLLTIAVPSFRAWLQNSQIRNAAHSITTGLQRARAEAVARNTNISFVLSADSSWTINVVNPALEIESRAASEGSQNATYTITPTGASTITFNNLGIITANADGSDTLAQVDISAPGGTRDLRVTIGAGGNAKMCDPSLPSGSSPTAC